MKKNVLVLIGFAFIVVPLSPIAFADEIVITNNGSGSDNTVTADTTTQTSVEQTNTATVINSQEITNNTGENTATGNTGTGDTVIETGNVSTAQTVDNTVNVSIAQVDSCCVTSSTTGNISSNGSYSSNNITYSSTANTNATVQNTAYLTNLSQGSGITGNNTASHNTGGDTQIKTGNITTTEKVNNKANFSYLAISTPSLTGFSAYLFGNGAGSTNTFLGANNGSTDISVTNIALLYNTTLWELLTGNNAADSNTGGNVSITTGDIRHDVSIDNDLNKNIVKVDCECEKEILPPPGCVENCGGGPNNPPTGGNPPSSPPPPSSGGNGGSSVGGSSSSNGGSVGSVLGASVEAMLPATGTPWVILAIIGNVLLLLFGIGLRLHSGRAPALSLAL